MVLKLGRKTIAGTSISKEPSRNIGQIIESLVPISDAGLHLLDGGIIGGSGAYSAFVEHMADLVASCPDLFISENDWQTAVGTYGVCGKFVYNSVDNTIRLPKITGFVEGTTDPTALGDLIEAGLPNITGTIESVNSLAWNKTVTTTGALSGETNSVNCANASNNAGTYTNKFILDASDSSSIYGNSTTVQPQAIQAMYYIVIATSAKTEVEVDINEVFTDLAEKVDIHDLRPVHCVIKTYVNGTSWYRVYDDGWCEQGGYSSSTQLTVNLLKHYTDTNYIIVSGLAGENKDYAPAFRNKTTSSFIGGPTTNGYTWYWEAKGYIDLSTLED